MIKDHCSNSCCIKCTCKCPPFDANACNELCKSSGLTTGGTGKNELGCTICRCVALVNKPSDVFVTTSCSNPYASVATCANHCFLQDKLLITDYCINGCCSKCDCGCQQFDSVACNKQCQQLGVIEGKATHNAFGCNVCKCSSLGENSQNIRRVQKEEHFSSG